MLTINYFGNIQDSLIGQIKTKVPISKKIEMVRTFKSPSRVSYNNTDQAVGPSSVTVTQSVATKTEHVRQISFKKEN